MLYRFCEGVKIISSKTCILVIGNCTYVNAQSGLSHFCDPKYAVNSIMPQLNPLGPTVQPWTAASQSVVNITSIEPHLTKCLSFLQHILLLRARANTRVFIHLQNQWNWGSITFVFYSGNVLTICHHSQAITKLLCTAKMDFAKMIISDKITFHTNWKQKLYSDFVSPSM